MIFFFFCILTFWTSNSHSLGVPHIWCASSNSIGIFNSENTSKLATLNYSLLTSIQTTCHE
jgi:hypothetical protein